MNIRELKEFIKDLPDDMYVVVADTVHGDEIATAEIQQERISKAIAHSIRLPPGTKYLRFI